MKAILRLRHWILGIVSANHPLISPKAYQSVMFSLERYGDPAPLLTALSRGAADASVLIFFVLSGVVIGLNEDGEFKKPSLIGYLERRAVRIMPIYVIAVVAGAMAAGQLVSCRLAIGAGFLPKMINLFILVDCLK